MKTVLDAQDLDASYEATMVQNGGFDLASARLDHHSLPCIYFSGRCSQSYIW